ncbi:MAG TPA: tryptophan synthase subunit alpha [Streptosporangiaceae bacterium]|jgi:tryptophan synthase alpha chain
MINVADAFGKARAQGRAAVIGYLPAGFPTVDVGIEAALTMARSGADIVEIGLPYSDPLMDGPVIQEAVHHALTGGVRVRDVLRTVEAVAATGVPVLVMTYWNPIDKYGVDAFAADLAGAGGAGLITPDLTPEESGPWLEAADAHGLDAVFLAAVSSTDERIARVTAACRGFVYAASLMGVTGERSEVSTAAQSLVGRIREHTSLPVAVGVGVRDGAQAAQIGAFADGVIVGTAFVRRLLDATQSARGIAEVGELAAELAAGVRAAVANPAATATSAASGAGV